MQPSDRDLPDNEDIIPFPVRHSESKGLLTTTIAALEVGSMKVIRGTSVRLGQRTRDVAWYRLTLNATE